MTYPGGGMRALEATPRPGDRCDTCGRELRRAPVDCGAALVAGAGHLWTIRKGSR